MRDLTIEQMLNKHAYNELFQKEINSKEFDYIRKKYVENNMDLTEDKEAYWIYQIYKLKMNSINDVDKRWEQIINEISYFEYLTDWPSKDFSRLIFFILPGKRSCPKKFLRAFCEMKKIEESKRVNFKYTKEIASAISSRMGVMNDKDINQLIKKKDISDDDKLFWKDFKKMKSHYGII